MARLTEVGRSAFRGALERLGRGWSRMQERRPLEHDLLESDDAYLVVFDAPGVEAGDVQVRFSDRTVEVRLDRFRAFRDGFDMRFPGRGLSLSGDATLPRDADVTPTGANATLTRSGTLQVEIPKNGDTSEVTVTEEGDDDAVDGGDEDDGDGDEADD